MVLRNATRSGRLRYPLHGQIGNLAADSLWIEYDEASGRLEVIGEIFETRMFFKRLRLRSRIRFTAGRCDVEVLDDVTNESSTEATMQLLYHINIGSPILDAGSVVEASLQQIAPKDDLAASEIDTWNQLSEPQSGYRERVYFGRMHNSEAGEAAAMLRNSKRDLGIGITYRTSTLPYFALWKNTAATEDGYVVGLEPSTNFPNQRTFETQHGRVVTIPAGETVPFRVGLHPLGDREMVEQFSERIANLMSDSVIKISREPESEWSA